MIYLLIDFGLAVLIGAFFLFLKDLTEWWEARQAAARMAQQQSAEDGRYVRVEGEAEGDADDELEGAAEGEEPHRLLELETRTNKNSSELARELGATINRIDELEVRTRVHKKATTALANAMREELKTLSARRAELDLFLGTGATKGAPGRGDGCSGKSGGAHASGGGGGVGGGAAARTVGSAVQSGCGTLHVSDAPAATAAAVTAAATTTEAGKPLARASKRAARAPSHLARAPKASSAAAASAAAKATGREAANVLQRAMKGPFVSLVLRTVTGVMAISLYFLDIISDVQVATASDTFDCPHPHPQPPHLTPRALSPAIGPSIYARHTPSPLRVPLCTTDRE